MSWSDWTKIQDEVTQVPVGDDALTALLDVRQKLRGEGIEPSERRLRESLKLISAQAWLAGASEAEPIHCEVLVNVFPSNAEQVRPVERAVLDIVSPAQSEALALADAIGGINDEFESVLSLDVESRYKPTMDCRKKLSRARKDAISLKNRAAGRALKLVEKAERDIEVLSDRIMKQGFEIE